MLQLRDWEYRELTDADLGTKLQFKQIPQQMPIKKLIILYTGTFTIAAAGGTTDYTVDSLFGPRSITTLFNRVGASNSIKDIPGYCNGFQTNLWYPTDWVQYYPASGTVAGFGATLAFQWVFTIQYSDADMEPPLDDETIFIPSRYENTLLQLELETLENLCSAGDRPYTFAGNMTILMEQNSQFDSTQVKPNAILREYIEEFPVESTGELSMELPRTEKITRINAWMLENGRPMLPANPFGKATVSVNRGQTDVYEARYASYAAYMAQNMNFLTVVEPPFAVLPLGFNLNHRGTKMLNNQKVSRWDLIMDVEAPVAPNTRSVLLHYIGRVPVA